MINSPFVPLKRICRRFEDSDKEILFVLIRCRSRKCWSCYQLAETQWYRHVG